MMAIRMVTGLFNIENTSAKKVPWDERRKHDGIRDIYMNDWLYLAAAIAAETLATSLLKSSEGFTRLGPSLIVVAGYGCTFFFLSLTLRTIPVGVAYAIWSGVGIILVTLVAWLIFGQKIDLPGLIGIGLIVTGVVVLKLFSKTSGH